jgi:dienelactone hydrolase
VADAVPVSEASATAARNLSPWAWFCANVAEATGGLAMPEEPRARRRRAGQKLRRLLGPLPERVPLNVTVTESVDCGAYRRDRVLYDSERHMTVPAYLLIPHRRTGPGAAILAQHGHGAGKAEVCGLAPGDEGGPPNDYAHQLAERGYVVLAPDLRTFGERADWNPPNIYSCDHSHMHASMLGYNLLTLHLWDLARGLDVLSDHPLVDPRRLGMVGLSQGGTCTLFLTAWDRRIRAAVVSGYVNDWATSATILWNMCGSQVLHGIVGELDHADLGMLVWPRPLLVETGTQDNIFPVDAARRAVDELRSLYGPDSERLVHDVYEGGHRWHGELAYPFLDRWLRHAPPR